MAMLRRVDGGSDSVYIPIWPLNLATRFPANTMVQWQSGTLPSCPAETCGQVTCDAHPRVVHNVPFTCDELNCDRTSKNPSRFQKAFTRPLPGLRRAPQVVLLTASALGQQTHGRGTQPAPRSA